MRVHTTMEDVDAVSVVFTGGTTCSDSNRGLVNCTSISSASTAARNESADNVKLPPRKSLPMGGPFAFPLRLQRAMQVAVRRAEPEAGTVKANSPDRGKRIGVKSHGFVRICRNFVSWCNFARLQTSSLQEIAGGCLQREGKSVSERARTRNGSRYA
jgi:hypothetical protein